MIVFHCIQTKPVLVAQYSCYKLLTANVEIMNGMNELNGKNNMKWMLKVSDLKEKMHDSDFWRAWLLCIVEKAAFAALDASDDEFEKYEELEDDFLFIANEG